MSDRFGIKSTFLIGWYGNDVIYEYNKMLNHGLAVQVLMFTGSQDSVIFIYDGFLTTFSEVQEWGWEKKGRNIDIFVTSSLKW